MPKGAHDCKCAEMGHDTEGNVNPHAALSPAVMPLNSSGSISHILHQSAQSMDDPKTGLFLKECKVQYEKSGWKYKFWTDEAIEKFVKEQFPNYYKQWSEMNPYIRKLDTVRYMWMYQFGGIYLDADGECIRDPTRFVDSLPPGNIAWIAGFPEPFVLASSPKNEFWLYFVEQILSDWKQKPIRHSSGPEGLNAAARAWLTGRTKSSVQEFYITDPGEAKWMDVTPNLPSWRWFIPQNDIMWGDKQSDAKLGFIPNELVDPFVCLQNIRSCQYSHCHERKEDLKAALFVHHCHGSWQRL